MINNIIILIMCHLIGDYVLQTNFIAESKGNNWYHLFVHCILYCVPFVIIFGITWQFFILFTMHFLIDLLKARYYKINYLTDQILHYLVCGIYLI
jgi:Na+-driven multidrug efflux pump